MSTLKASDLPAAVAVEAHRLSRVERGYEDDARWFRGAVARSPGDARSRSRVLASERGRDVHLGLLGDLLLAEAEAGDRIIIGAHLYELVATGGTTSVKLAGEWEPCDALAAVYLGDAPLPGEDDEDDDITADDELAERRGEYAEAIRSK